MGIGRARGEKKGKWIIIFNFFHIKALKWEKMRKMEAAKVGKSKKKIEKNIRRKIDRNMESKLFTRFVIKRAL